MMDDLYVVAHTHWDREWYLPFQRMRARLVAMTDRMLTRVADATIPTFHFDGQAIVLEDYLEVRPEKRALVKQLIRAGRLKIGPWYVLADSFLASGESLIRNLDLGIGLSRRFGRPVMLGYLPDQFGHMAQMPQILAGFGFRCAVVWRGVGADIQSNRFIWEALDRSAIFTIYLPFGYSNGANLPVDSDEALLARLRTIGGRERSFARGAPILLMAGTDHAEPDPRLSESLSRVAKRADGLRVEVGSLENYADRLAAMPRDALPLHRGELRSPARAHLLPGVTSARSWIKQRDFENCGLLERLADPLAALAHAAGRESDLAALLDLAWRFEIQNQAHDSICGCSIDQVHRDMRYRFDQARLIGEEAVRRSAGALLESRAGGPPMIAVFNPTFATSGQVRVEAELAGAADTCSLLARDGRRIRPAVDPVREERTFEIEIPAPDLKAIVAGLRGPAMMGRSLLRYRINRSPRGRVMLKLFLGRTATGEFNLADFQRTVARRLPDTGAVTVRGVEAPRYALSFIADDLVQTGFSFYRVVHDKKPSRRRGTALVRDDSIENEFYRVRPSTRGLSITDLETGRNVELHFEDEGDRGDEYNFDRVPGSPPVTKPRSRSARVLERSGTRRRLEVHLRFRLPHCLEASRRSRSGRLVDFTVDLAATLFMGLRRVDFETRVSNHAQDHRFRVAFRTPIAATEALHDTSFGVVRRLLKAPEAGGAEDVYPTVPHRTVSAVESPGISVAMLSRGLYEVEVRPESRGSTILLTLLRCVGWLSRSDLRMRRGAAGPEVATPDAQEPGRHRFELALVTYRGDYLKGDLMPRAAAYAWPPRGFPAGAVPVTEGGLRLGRCDNPRVLFSTARPTSRPGTYILRAWSVSPQKETARFDFGQDARVRRVDLAGRRVKAPGGEHSGSDLRGVRMRPFEIVTFEVRRGMLKDSSAAMRNH